MYWFILFVLFTLFVYLVYFCLFFNLLININFVFVLLYAMLTITIDLLRNLALIFARFFPLNYNSGLVLQCFSYSLDCNSGLVQCFSRSFYFSVSIVLI